MTASVCDEDGLLVTAEIIFTDNHVSFLDESMQQSSNFSLEASTGLYRSSCVYDQSSTCMDAMDALATTQSSFTSALKVVCTLAHGTYTFGFTKQALFINGSLNGLTPAQGRWNGEYWACFKREERRTNLAKVNVLNQR